MILQTQYDVPYLPLPNSIEVMADRDMAPMSLTKTAFMIPLLPNGSVVLANNRRRGLEFPGGHIDPGETMCGAAHRETVEETGHWVSHIKAIGYLRMISQGTVPEGWRYPHPLGYQQFFVADVMWAIPYIENDECLTPVILSPREARIKLKPSRAALYELALRSR
jgi:8-oxo-dGTP pyrophosphatase MutT (NUDIX family)